MAVRVLTDADVARRVSMPAAIDAIEAALARRAQGRFVTPPRHYVGNERGALAFTIGGDAADGVIGFRVYAMGFPGGSRDDQLVAVYDAASGRLKGLVAGSWLGELRTGAIGGVAIKHAARPDAATLALIGSGGQARTQLLAAAAVRELRDVRVYSRDAARRLAFAEEMTERAGVAVRPAASPEEAVRDADIVITATSSRAPVLDVALLRPGMHVSMLGAKQRDASELDPAVAGRATAIVTDSPAQLESPVPSFLAGTPDAGRVTDLASHVAGGPPVRASADDITLFLSVGLSGTEVVVADLALRE